MSSKFFILSFKKLKYFKIENKSKVYLQFSQTFEYGVSCVLKLNLNPNIFNDFLRSKTKKTFFIIIFLL